MSSRMSRLSLACLVASTVLVSGCDPYARAPKTPAPSGDGDSSGHGSVAHITDANFKQEVLDHKGVVLVDFWATWCGPCKALAPTIDQIATDYKGRVKVAKLDVDQSPATAKSFNVSGIPLVIVFKDGKKQDQILGLEDKAKYVAALDKALR